MPSLDNLRQEAQWRRWRRSAEAFCEGAVHIQHPRGRRLLALRDAQRETLKTLQHERRVIILKARQIGYTTLMGAYALWLVLFQEDQNIILLSKTERDAQDFLARIRFAYDLLPYWVKQRAPALKSDTLQKLEFSNNSRVESLPSKEDPARGRTVTLVIVDEWASLDNPEEAWASIEPIVDIGGAFIGLSTAKGFGNFFHTMWVRARTGTMPFKALFYSWRAVPDRDDAWYEEKKQLLPMEWQIHQEYPTDEEEAFIKSGRTVFDIDLLRALPKESARIGYLWRDKGQREFRVDARGELSIWAEPELGHRYAIGADVAEGLEHGDFSSAHVIDVRSGQVVAHWHGHVEPDLFGQELDQLGRWYNRALVGVEVNASGGTVCNTLQRLSYPRIYYRRTLLDREHRVTSQVGWRTTKSSKPLMIDDLAMVLRQQDLDLRDEYTISELMWFVRDEKGGMGGSPHDDRVISLAIAQQMRQHVSAPEFEAEEGPIPGTMGWYVDQAIHESVPDDVIGLSNVRSSAA